MPLKLKVPVEKLSVDSAKGQLTNLALLSGNREAKGHRLWIDEKTLQTALDSIQERGGKLKAAITHETYAEWWNEEDRLLRVPGYFDSIRVENGILEAGTFDFYDAFKASSPADFALLMEMAEKTPTLFGLSIEASGYLVYVGEDGNEYKERPEDVELQYNGMPAFRITDLTAAAFVSEPAANDGLFARFKALLPQKSKGQLDTIETALKSIASKLEALKPEEEKEPEKKTQFSNTNNQKMNELLKALRAEFGADHARLGRAVALSDNYECETKEQVALAVQEIKKALQAEDDAAELVELRKKNEELEELRKEKEALEKQLDSKENNGESRPLELHAPGIVGLTSKSTGLTQRCFAELQARGVIHKNFAVTGIGDLWVPEYWAQGMAEYVPLSTSFFGSGAVASNKTLTERAAGGGRTINVPFFKEPDQDDELQEEGEDATIHGFNSGMGCAPRLNRQNTLGTSGLSGLLSASDPITFALNSVGGLRDRNKFRALISILRGCFGTAFADLSTDISIDDGNAATGDNLFDDDAFSDAIKKMGEVASRLSGGAILCHSSILQAMTTQELVETKQPSELPIEISLYRGNIPIFASDLLVTPGATSGSVYDTYILAPNTIGQGYKPQSNTTGDPASLQIEEKKLSNDVIIIDRTSGYIHPNFAEWTGAAAKPNSGPTNAELATAGNWASAADSLKNVGILQLKTNG